MSTIINTEEMPDVRQMRQVMTRADVVKAAASHVQVIPATKLSGQNAQLKMRSDIRVAAYCRVSTGDESQQTSYTNQKAYYSGLIHSQKGWNFAGLYADEGISGTSVARRTQFNAMIQDAKDGKIDYIVTKSISRFARNTLDTLTYVRELKELNPKVGIFFEKENLDTLDVRGEMVLTVLAAIAQEESHSISENIRWGIRKRFEAGIPMVNLNRMLGYDKGENGEWIINEEQAAVIRGIFSCFINGLSANSIAQSLNAAGIGTVLGNKWTAATILNILRNEKYVGDIEMQKTFTKDFLSHSAETNMGELPKFYIENHHTAIIGREEWKKAKKRLDKRKCSRYNTEEVKSSRGTVPSIFNNLVCGADCMTCSAADDCRKNFCRLTYSTKAIGYKDERSIEATGADSRVYNEEYLFSHPVWKHKAENKDRLCPLAAINECSIKQGFMEMLYGIKYDYETNGENSRICKDFKAVYDEITKNAEKGNATSGELSAIEENVKTLKKKIDTCLYKQANAMCDIAMDSDTELASAVAAGKMDRNDILTDIWNGLKNPELGPQFYHVNIPENSQAAIYADIVKDLRIHLEALLIERESLKSDISVTPSPKEQFEAFLRALTELPKKNGAGMDIRVNGMDTKGSIFRETNGKAKEGKRGAYKKGRLTITPERIAAAPDYLDFADAIYRDFVVEGTAIAEKIAALDDGEGRKTDTILKADRIIYKTTFGLMLTSTGNSRSLGAFLGFKRNGLDKEGKTDGTIQFIDQAFKVDGGKIRYKRTERIKKNSKENIFIN